MILGGYDLVFVDIDKNLVSLLNKEKKYSVVIKGESDRKFQINLSRAIELGDKTGIISEIINADICAVSVGQRGLPGVGEILANGLKARYQQKPEKPLDIILAENLRDASGWMKSYLQQIMPSSFPLDSYVGLVETSIGKMVPIMTEADMKNDPLQVFAESYNTLILDEKAFKNPVPEIPFLAPKKNMKAWVDRKLFIHNLGHSSLAYLANQKNSSWRYTWEALEDEELKMDVYECMEEAADVLMHMHPGEFSAKNLTDHIQDLLERFGNKALGDTIFRVGCDLERKLGPEDRLVPVIRYAYEHKLPYQKVLRALIAGIFFNGHNEAGNMFESDLKFIHQFHRDVARILSEHCKFNALTEKEIIHSGIQLSIKIKHSSV